jgi:hypothetical protein
MANFEVERLGEGLYCIHSTLTQRGDRVTQSSEGNIVIFAQDMLSLMDWCQRNVHEVEEDVRKVNRRIEKRNKKRGQS